MNDKKSRLKALSQLLNARMQHTKWVAEVVSSETPGVEEDHTKCDFGKWLIDVDDELGQLQEYQDLIEPHRELHEAFSLLKDVPGMGYHPAEIKYLSSKLIDCIDQLEKRLSES